MSPRASRACRSSNHPKGEPKSPTASIFKCPKCRRWFCTDCEGCADGFKVCDACWADIVRLSEEHITLSRFKRMVRKYAYRRNWREILQEAGL